jgi:hypothetical protein
VVSIRQRKGFYRYAEAHLIREAFPALPDRSHFNRLVRFFYAEDIENIAVKLGQRLWRAANIPTRLWTPRR